MEFSPRKKLGKIPNLTTWKAKCPIFKVIVAGFRGKVALKNRTLGVPGNIFQMGWFNHQLVYWVFPKIGVPQNGWFLLENPIKMDDLGENPLFSETSIVSILRRVSQTSRASVKFFESFRLTSLGWDVRRIRWDEWLELEDGNRSWVGGCLEWPGP